MKCTYNILFLYERILICSHRIVFAKTSFRQNGGIMRIVSLQVNNYKGLKSLNIDMNGKNTFFIGVNGMGKSSILSVINYLFWPWLYRVNPAQKIEYRSLNADLLSQDCNELLLAATIRMGNNEYMLTRSYEKARRGKSAQARFTKTEYDRLADDFRKLIDNPEKGYIPIFVNYGTNRSVLDIPLRIRNKHAFSQLTALEHSTENALSFRTFFEWYRNQEDYEGELRRDNPNYEDIPLRCVRKVVQEMMGEFSDLRVRRNPLRMTVVKNGTELRVDQLSDGEKCTLALLGDLARRVALANMNRNNPLEGEGVVLIDEIELHMHPSWQQKVFGVLQRMFPNIQFIITTHSPLILSEISEDDNVFLFSKNNDGIFIEPISTYGKDSNSILESVMGTSERNPIVGEQFERFYKAMDEEKYEDAEEILTNLEELIGEDAQLVSCRVQLRMENGVEMYDKD